METIVLSGMFGVAAILSGYAREHWSFTALLAVVLATIVTLWFGYAPAGSSLVSMIGYFIGSFVAALFMAGVWLVVVYAAGRGIRNLRERRSFRRL